jgi:HK97 family phage portal protein
MSMRDYLPSWLGGKRSEPVQNASYPTSAITQGSPGWNDLFGSMPALTYPTEDTAFTISAIYASVNLIAGAISGLPMHIFRVSADGERDRIQNDPLWWVLNEEMTPRWAASAGWEFMAQSLLMHGDAFAVILRRPDSMPMGIKPIHPNRVSVLLNTATERLVYSVTPESGVPGAVQVYDQDDMLHVAGFGFNGFRGMSPLRYALRTTGAISLATQDFSANFFANSARPDYALTTEQKLSPETIEAMRAQIDERHRGPDKAFRPMVLQGGLDIKTITMPIDDMQLVAMRQFQIEDIARIYGVPPFMIGHNDKTTSWGSGIESMGIGFVRFTLRQHLNKFETEFNRKLFRTYSKRVEFDTFDLERADMKTMFESYRIAIGRAGEPGFMTSREVRQRLNMKRDPDGELNSAAPATPAPQPDPQQVTQ